MTEELKYAHEWFELLKDQIPQPFRFEIEDNFDKEYKHYKPCKKDVFIQHSFNWQKSTISIEYWDDVDDFFNKDGLQQLADKVNEERWNNLKVGDTLYSIQSEVNENKFFKTTIRDKTEKIFTIEHAVPLLDMKKEYFRYSKDNWFHYWTPIKPKHWKEKLTKEDEAFLMGELSKEADRQALEKKERTIGKEETVTDSEILAGANKLLSEAEAKWILSEENAIELLKSKGYKIMKPVTNYEEI